MMHRRFFPLRNIFQWNQILWGPRIQCCRKENSGRFKTKIQLSRCDDNIFFHCSLKILWSWDVDKCFYVHLLHKMCALITIFLYTPGLQKQEPLTQNMRLTYRERYRYGLQGLQWKPSQAFPKPHTLPVHTVRSTNQTWYKLLFGLVP